MTAFLAEGSASTGAEQGDSWRHTERRANVTRSAGGGIGTGCFYIPTHSSLEPHAPACNMCEVPKGPKSSSRDRRSRAYASCSRVLRGGLDLPLSRLSIGFHDIPTCSANARMLTMSSSSIRLRIMEAIRATASYRARSRANSKVRVSDNGMSHQGTKLQYCYSSARIRAR